MPGKPVKFVGEEEEPLKAAPNLGEHNAEVYGALAIDSVELAHLQQQGVI